MRRVVLVTAAAVLLACVLPASAAAAQLLYQYQFGSGGTGAGQFSDCARVEVVDGHLWVSDRGGCRIEVFTLDGAYLFSFGSAGAGAGQLTSPISVAVDAGPGRVYVCDSSNSRIQIFTMTGGYVGQLGSMGAGDGQFNTPYGIDIGPDGNLYVAEYINNRVQVIAKDGTFVRKWGSAGVGDGEFSSPRGLAFAPDGTLWVADQYNYRLQHFQADGTFIDKIDVQAGPGGDQRPADVSFDDEGNIYMGCSDHSVRVYDAAAPHNELTSFGSGGSGAGQFVYAYGVDVAPDGRVFVADLFNNRVQVLVFDDTPPVVSCDNDGEWHSTGYTIDFFATDDYSGVTQQVYNIGSGWVPATFLSFPAPTDHSNDGRHTVQYSATDGAGNSAVAKTTRVKIDTRAPLTRLFGVPAGYTRSAATVEVVPTDVGAGVGRTWVKVDGAPDFTPLGDSQIDFSTAGYHSIEYYSEDQCIVPNLEDAKLVDFTIDQMGPTAKPLKAVSVVRGRKATFKYSLLDDFSPTCAVKLVIKKKSKVVKTVALGAKDSTTALPDTFAKKLAVKLAAGTYTWTVVATDLAGNVGSYAPKKLTVR